MTYAKTPSGKLSEQSIKDFAKSLGKDNVGVENRGGKYRLNIARAYARMHYGKEEKRISTGLSIVDSNGKIDKANADTVSTKVAQMHNDLANGYFDKTFVKYGLAPDLTAIDGGKKQKLSLLALYDMYCESRKGTMEKTTLELDLKDRFRKAIKEANDKFGENALDIRNYLVDKWCTKIAQESLRHLSKAYQLGIEHKDETGTTEDPFAGMAKKLSIKKIEEDLDDEDGDDDKRAFSIDEMNAIIEAFESSGYRRHFAPIIKFLFWTGCRTGEAIGLKWKDIKWDDESIVILRTYNEELKFFKKTKTRTSRIFPMPQNGVLWNLLKTLPERDPNDVVFQAKHGGIINGRRLAVMWRGKESDGAPGVIKELIKQGKVKQYLKLYSTRHTFISHQVNIRGIPITTVAAWVGNGAMVSNNDYLDRDRLTVPGYSNAPTQVQTNAPTQTPTNNLPDQVIELLTSLTPEQLEQIKVRLNS